MSRIAPLAVTPLTAPPAASSGLAGVLGSIRDGAEALDVEPAFPAAAFSALETAGILRLTVLRPGGHPGVGQEWATVRAVAAADASVARILDGHLNAVERLAVSAPEPLRGEDLHSVEEGDLLLGVWGADPAPGEGEPARLTAEGTIEGSKVFCSGAGGIGRALVLVRGDAPGPPLLAYVDVTDRAIVDRSWFRGAGMRASESHRVDFHGARVLAVLGEPGEIAREPFFGRDAIRTAASWAGAADAALAAMLEGLSSRADDDLAAVAAGRAVAAHAAIDAWFAHAEAFVEADPEAPLADLSIQLRVGVDGACRTILSEAEQALGSRPFAAAGRLDRARRDLGIFLLQHRLDPLVAKMGRRALS